MTADVAQSERAQNRVGHGVEQRVGVRMTFRAKVGRDFDAAQNQRTTFRQTMHVVAVTDSYHFVCSFFKIASAKIKSL